MPLPVSPEPSVPYDRRPLGPWVHHAYGKCLDFLNGQSYPYSHEDEGWAILRITFWLNLGTSLPQTDTSTLCLQVGFFHTSVGSLK